MDIHKGFGNANIILGRLLYKALEKENIQLISIDGGGLRNAIPREAVAVASVRNAQEFIEEVQRT
jgi:dipeptidase D